MPVNCSPRRVCAPDTERASTEPELQLFGGHRRAGGADQVAKADCYWITVEGDQGIDPSITTDA